MLETLTILFVLILAYFNGANDNFKGVATLYGGGILDYRACLRLASVATFVGCLLSLVLADTLAKKFSGSGLVSSQVFTIPSFPLIIAGSAVFTVALATFLGFPISTTHSLLGALVGAGIVMGQNQNFGVALSILFAPLLLSPLIAFVVAAGGWLILRNMSSQPDVLSNENHCLCVNEVQMPVAVGATAINLSIVSPLAFDTKANCQTKGLKEIMTLPRRDQLHLLSSFSVCAARGMNDAPKIAGILLVSSLESVTLPFYLLISLAMVAGGIFHSKTLAERMSFKLSELRGQTSAWSNFVTSLIVLVASRFGVPVSTTHTSCGTIAGVGTSDGRLHLSEFGKIIGAWFLTLPIAGVTAAVLALFCRT